MSLLFLLWRIYTIDFKETEQLINEILLKVAVPLRYESIVGTEQVASDFIKLLHSNIKGMILIKNR